MPRPETEQAVAETAPLPAARAAAGAAGATGAGTSDPVAGELRRAGVLPLLVLHLLDDGPSYGNLLIDRIAELSGGLLVVNPNTMYPLLRGLEQRGLVTGEWEHPERRSRRFYAITPAGEAERERLRVDVAPRLAAVAGALERLRGERRLMGRTSARVLLPGVRIADAEALWYDRVRQPSFVDGMKQVVRVEGDYPQAGSCLVWESFPGGRGRVTERVVRYEPRAGQEVEVADAKTSGRQRVAFAAEGGDVRMTLELEYTILEPGPLTPITDLLFIRRAQGDALRRTLARFARELHDERDPPL